MCFFQVEHKPIILNYFFKRSKSSSPYTECLVPWIKTKTREFLSSQTQSTQHIIWVWFWTLNENISSYNRSLISIPPKNIKFPAKGYILKWFISKCHGPSLPLGAEASVYFSNVPPGNITIKHFIIHLRFIFFPSDVSARYGMHEIHCCF